MLDNDFTDEGELRRAREDYTLKHFPKGKFRSGGIWWETSCPLHDDDKPSLGINIETGGYYCHSCDRKGYLDQLAEAAGLPAAPRRRLKKRGDDADQRQENERPKPAKPPVPKSTAKLRVVCEYLYRTADGANHQKVIRKVNDETGKKTFAQARWEKGKWIHTLTINAETGEKLPRLPYNLDKITASPPDKVVLWVEGEKDADALTALGLLATTSPQGAKSSSCLDRWEMFQGLHVVILPDRDEPGQGYAQDVAVALRKAGARLIEICNLPGQGPVEEKHGKDVSDWLATGRSKDDLLAAIAEHAEEFTAIPRADIQVDWRPPHEVAKDVLAQLGACEIYNKGDELVLLERRSGDSPPRLVPLSKPALLAHLAELMDFHEQKKHRPVMPPPWVADMIFNARTMFPRLNRLTELPYVNRAGDLVQREGLDAEGTLLLPLYPDLIIPANATAAQAAEAAQWLGSLLGDFDFTKPYHRTHSIAAMLQPFVMPYINNRAPIFACSASTEGSGKSRLAKVIALVGSIPGITTVLEQGNPQHFETAVFTALRMSPTALLLDNVKSDLDFGWIQGLLTAPEVLYRLLSTNQSIWVRSPDLWMVSANNPGFGRETRRRMVPIDLDPQVEDPYNRPESDFKIPDIEQYVVENRVAILERVYTILRHWIGEGRPTSSKHSVGSFERWSKVLGGVLHSCGLTDFLDNKREEAATLDHEILEWRHLLEYWAEHPPNSKGWATPLEVADLCKTAEVMFEITEYTGAGQRSSRMGRALSRMLRRIFNGFRVIRQKGRRGWEYAVERVENRGGGPEMEPPEPPSPGPQPPGGVSPEPADHATFADLSLFEGRQPQTVGVASVAAAADHADLSTASLMRMPARAHEGAQDKVGMVGMVSSQGGQVEKKNSPRLGQFTRKVSEKKLVGIRMALASRRSSYAARGSDFGSENPKWSKEVRPLIESGQWIPPTDLPWDSTLAIGPPPGWVFDGDLNSSGIPNSSPVAPARASPPEDDRSLGDLLSENIFQ